MKSDHKSEAQTRTSQIDVELARAGWSVGRRNLVEEHVLRTGEPDAPGDKEQFADYVLLGSDGKPIAVVEAKRSSRDAIAGKRQAADYATIGNMGRVIYVFEVQTKGSIDSLILNLLKSLNNPAVQGVVAVSDMDQLEKIRKHAAGVPQLREKLKYWDYTEVLQVHEALEAVNESINKLGLVPEGFMSL